MEENSREEDIKNLNEIIELSKEEIDAKDENITAILDIEDLISLEHILSEYKRVLKENEGLKEYIAIAPNLDKMTAVKYRNIQQDAYIKGRAEEQQRAEQIIYENYIPIQKVKDKIEELEKRKQEYEEENTIDEDYFFDINGYNSAIFVLQELLELESGE